jgi:hypothetical protein
MVVSPLPLWERVARSAGRGEGAAGACCAGVTLFPNPSPIKGEGLIPTSANRIASIRLFPCFLTSL